MDNIYDQIKAVALKNGYTLIALSEKMGITRQALNAAMKSPSYPTLTKIAEALEIPIWQLFASREEVLNENKNETAGVCPHCGKPITIETSIK